MYNEWSLDVFYKGIDDPELDKDIARLDMLNGEFKRVMSEVSSHEPASVLRKIMEVKEAINFVAFKLNVFLRLRRSANNMDKEGDPYRARMQILNTACTKEEVRFKQYVGEIEDLDRVLESDDLLREYKFFFNRMKKSIEHTLPEGEEYVFSRVGSSCAAWSEQYSYLMSHTECDVLGEKKTMNGLQPLFKSPDPKIRKAAYEAEIENYPRIKDALAYSLNTIKKHVNTEAALRGYESPLEMSLDEANLKKETIDAMWSAIIDFFPKCRQYLKHKAKLLGYENGLPWYEMYAIVGKRTEKTYTPEDTHKYLVEQFAHFCTDMSDMMDRAFKENWIDFYSRPGKSGGAFCYGLPYFKQSRILTNYANNFSSINTLAHELGHAFHAMHMQNKRPFNRINPLPLSETASTFNEVFFMTDAIKRAEGDEKIALIDKQLVDFIMVVPDMYTRFKFEDSVFRAREEGRFLYSKELDGLMLDIQKEVYGDSLDNDFLHPYMWCVKNHHYSITRSYYNFPYSFGALFARGLYAKYEEEGDAFIPKYRRMLGEAPVHNVEETARICGIDVTDPDFWKKSLKSVEKQIDDFIESTSK